MKIQRLQIDNFRGINSLDWKLPVAEQLISLVGAGDSGKSTILEAIHFLLGDRWNITFSDTDFYGTDVEQPISIMAVLVDVPAALLKESAFGLWQSGVDTDGDLHQDPEDQYTPALVVRLRVDETLEPQWTVERADGEAQRLTASQRRSFSTFKVDDRTDAQLRWTRTSALGRMSAQDGSERAALAEASRAAREALADHDGEALAAVAVQVQERTNSIGGGSFSDVRPGLDTSRSSMGASLALYEGAVPLTSYGLGTRRLASLAAQQLAAGTRAIAVVDEVENGLEPHRAVRLLEYLRQDDDYSQVIITTHSPVIVEQAPLESLSVVQNLDGVVTVTSLSGDDERAQRMRRSRPSSFLGRRIVIAEGKTEHGVLLECVGAWDAERVSAGLSTSAGEGVVIQDGEGGTEVPARSIVMRTLGYEVAGLLDNDDRSVDASVAAAEAVGVKISRWAPGLNIEQQIVSQLGPKGLKLLLEKVGVELRHHANTVLSDINDTSASGSTPVTTLDVRSWKDLGITLEESRSRIAHAMNKRSWFKTVDGGRVLGAWLMKYQGAAALASTFERLDEIKRFIYGGQAATEEADEASAATSDG